jgi:hypothetical protein
MIFDGREAYVSEEPTASIFRLADFFSHIDELIWTVLGLYKCYCHDVRVCSELTRPRSTTVNIWTSANHSRGWEVLR